MLLSAPLLASPVAVRCRPLAAKAKIRVDMAATPLRKVARAMSCWLGLNLVVAPAISGRKVDVVAPHAVRRDALLPLFRAALRLSDLHLDMRQGHGVIRSGRAPTPRPPPAVRVRIRHVDARAVAAAVGRLCGHTPSALPDGHSLQLVGERHAQAQQRRWISWLDQPGGARKIYLVRVHHRDPMRLAALVREVMRSGGRSVRVVGNPRTRQLIIVARPSQWPLVHAAIQRLDVNSR